MISIKTLKKCIATIIAVIALFSMSIWAYAEDSKKIDDNLIITRKIATSTEITNGIARSSIGGYGTQTISAGKTMMLVYTDSDSGIFGGGMGITIETSCSAGTYDFYVSAAAEGNRGSGLINVKLNTNQHWYDNDLYQYGPAYYAFFFDVPDGTPDFNVQIWIYG